MDNDPQDQENVETPEASSTEEQTPESELTPELSEREVDFAKQWTTLKGSTQDRIKQILNERDQYKEQLEQRQVQQAQQDVQSVSYQPQSNAVPQASDAEIQQAVEVLRSKGNVATKEDLYAMLDQIERSKDHDRLEDKYDGSNGLPRYDRVEVEDYMKKNRIYGRPEAAFRDMYFDEFVDANKTSKRRKTYTSTEKPTSPGGSREEPMSTETFREKLSGPKGREYFEKLRKNPKELDALVKQLSQE